MKILFLEPFYGGSHKDFALGLSEHSSHEIEVMALPPRFWKWRMRGASLYFLEQIRDISAYDLIFATDMMDLAGFKGLAGRTCPPVVFYFHENQLSYPLGPHQKRDSHLGFTNIISALGADAVLFNSKFHKSDFLKAARTLVKQMPDTQPFWMMDEIEDKARVLYPGCRYPADLTPVIGETNLDRPLVVWNHRWEYDKNPDLFFRVLGRLKEKGVAFYLALMGEQYEMIPKVFEKAKEEFKDEILVKGFQASAEDYRDWLAKGTVVVSTAIQENFGISVMEAVAFGCLPILPNRLSYPELVPSSHRQEVIYNSEKGLETRLERVLTRPEIFEKTRRNLAVHAAGFSWETLILEYDGLMEKIAASVKN